jgi:hypothetical protein
MGSSLQGWRSTISRNSDIARCMYDPIKPVVAEERLLIERKKLNEIAVACSLKADKLEGSCSDKKSPGITPH